MPKGANRASGRCELWIARRFLSFKTAKGWAFANRYPDPPHRRTSLRLFLEGGSQLRRGGRRRFTSEVRLGVVEAPAVAREKAVIKPDAVTVNEGTMKEPASKAEDNGKGKDLKRKHPSSSVEDGGADKNKTQPTGVGRGGKALHRRAQ
jgi:hypothetical protein